MKQELETILKNSKTIAMIGVSSLKEKEDRTNLKRKPSTIVMKYMQDFGYKVIPVKKTKNSILSGIDRMRTQPIRVYKTSQNLQMELQNYIWAKNGRGETLAKPIDKYNHLIDAARYWAMGELEPIRKKRGKRASGLAKSALTLWR